MNQTWKPTPLGKIFTRFGNWSLELDGEAFQICMGNHCYSDHTLLLEQLKVESGVFWAKLTLSLTDGRVLALGGLSNGKARKLRESISSTANSIRHQRRVAEPINTFDKWAPTVVAWVKGVQSDCSKQLRNRGWLGQEFQQLLARSKPRAPADLLVLSEVRSHLATCPKETQQAMAFWERPFEESAIRINQRQLRKVLESEKDFFNRVEKSPLTREQAEAVVTLDNRVLLVAAAGSGKTSTMVAKAGYVLKRGYVEPDRVLLLAFNTNAAKELRERIEARLKPQGLPVEQVTALTFHAFGRAIIGEATGKAPTVPSWLDHGQDIDALLNMVDRLKDENRTFRTQWDMFRVLFQQDLPQFGQEQHAPDSWDREREREGFWTLNNEVVKSRGEQLIANWLFYNGVRYAYEAPYEHETADPQHRQYQPDFYLPDAKAYLEHWALDANGEPPAEFTGYKEGMTWKRRVHATYGTRLLETTMAGLWSGEAFAYLETELRNLGIELDPNPDRPAPGRPPIEDARLARVFRSFLTHTKSNRLTIDQLYDRLRSGALGEFRYRHEMFLSLFAKLWTAWESRLRDDNAIDFEDMLTQAADHIEAGRWRSPYELIMVDEFQDVSQARTRLIASLIARPNRYLFAVGDDWQSINRFAGADLSVMTEFEHYFGHAATLKLETTFRCPQSLCDIASTFVQKNPKQIPKRVNSAKPDRSEPVHIMRVLDETRLRAAVETRIAAIAAQSSSKDAKPRVLVLGRYRRDKAYMPMEYDAAVVEVAFRTVHESKGLEADHIIVPRVTSEVLGIPSRVEDDPVLRLAMPNEDEYEYAEERRLFYVALTRARSTVTLITIESKESPFVRELANGWNLEIENQPGCQSTNETCPSCAQGFLTERSGKWGSFLGCSRYPRCKHTQSLPK